MGIYVPLYTLSGYIEYVNALPNLGMLHRLTASTDFSGISFTH